MEVGLLVTGLIESLYLFYAIRVEIWKYATGDLPTDRCLRSSMMSVFWL